MTDELMFQQRAVLWGQTFEVLVKRGTLACLDDNGLCPKESDAVPSWREVRTSAVYHALTTGLGLIDEEAIEQVRTAGRHLATLAWGLGYTTMREYLKRIQGPRPRRLQLKALWCPLVLPGVRDSRDIDETRVRFHRALGLPGDSDLGLSGRGMPANADFLLWLEDSGDQRPDHLLVQEYSYDMPSQIGDFREETAHLEELLRHRRLVECRGVFARVAAEVEEEEFALSPDLRTHLTALSAEDKPFYKLCQAAAYAESTTTLLGGKQLLRKGCLVRALAITPNGLESLAANFRGPETRDPRFALMAQLGTAYRQSRKVGDGDMAALTGKVEALFNNLLRRLPAPLYQGLKDLRHAPRVGEDLELRFEEKVPEFSNPTQLFRRDEALGMVDDTPALQSYFGEPPHAAVARVLDPAGDGNTLCTLRDLHQAAVIAGLRAAHAGKLNLLGLEGNPGIGKTTAVIEFLDKQDGGYLFLYVSPRVVINRDVTEKLARRNGEPTGTLTVTTNAQLISSAERWHSLQVEQGLDTRRRHIDGAVVADGVEGLQRPTGSILVLTPEQEHEIEAAHAGSRLAKTTLSEHEDLVQERPLLGVLAAMAMTTRDLLDLNPGVDRTVLTAAIQGFREKSRQRTTIESLSRLFENPAGRPAGIREREAFAARMPLVIVMVDELAGDGAGTPFVHAVAQWLKQEFVEPFEKRGSPFTVILIASDASLSNEVVFERYLDAGERAPDKVLVSKSSGGRCFRLAATKVRAGIGRSEALHVLTNSFPARELSIEYRVTLRAVRLEASQGKQETPRQAVRRTWGEALLGTAVDEIKRALAAGAQQVIYFAQDKYLLGDLQGLLRADRDLALDRDEVQVLDSSVPGWRRKALIQEDFRDTVKVFLMTSSGARGVSFPLTDWIIAAVPRFSIEASLMEIAQLIYRGRGTYTDRVSGERVSGDNANRRLVMHVDDFIVGDERLDPRQWLRQATDLLTLVAMLRSTILTRITGDAGMKRQRLALVPVGAVGLEELSSLMSSHVGTFVKEAETYVRRGDKETTGRRDLVGLVEQAKRNVIELFGRFRLDAIAPKGESGWSLVRTQDARSFVESTGSAMLPLLPAREDRHQMRPHVYFGGPIALECWSGFDKREAFSFEGWQTQIEQSTRDLQAQLYRIDHERALPQALRAPAANLYRLLAREKPEAANEFSTLKDLKSPRLWVAMPIAYPQFVAEQTGQATEQWVREPDAWRAALAGALGNHDTAMPQIPQYHDFPWAAAVGQTDPLGLAVVFDDRYFMVSNELNLLNTILLAEEVAD